MSMVVRFKQFKSFTISTLHSSQPSQEIMTENSRPLKTTPEVLLPLYLSSIFLDYDCSIPPLISHYTSGTDATSHEIDSTTNITSLPQSKTSSRSSDPLPCSVDSRVPTRRRGRRPLTRETVQSLEDSQVLISLGMSPFMPGQDAIYNQNRFARNEAILAWHLSSLERSFAQLESNRDRRTEEIYCDKLNHAVPELALEEILRAVPHSSRNLAGPARHSQRIRLSSSTDAFSIPALQVRAQQDPYPNTSLCHPPGSPVMHLRDQHRSQLIDSTTIKDDSGKFRGAFGPISNVNSDGEADPCTTPGSRPRTRPWLL
ncbi:hypothetical protein CPB84DRAFT_1792509 [Gymnopilus junonius]|uniref:Uncharacterized protein n=1 Tax=Gymnopilus junonius TaxID=109634 RepID=A0A9P5TH71_GYMJU|nr:hypothetical protein CPB84DRAFT_1792509 [Gymnopilus junonius]